MSLLLACTIWQLLGSMGKRSGRGGGRASTMVVMFKGNVERCEEGRGGEGRLSGGQTNPCTSPYVQCYRGISWAKNGFLPQKCPAHCTKLPPLEVGRQWGVSECRFMTSPPSDTPDFPPNFEFKPTRIPYTHFMWAGGTH